MSTHSARLTFCIMNISTHVAEFGAEPFVFLQVIYRKFANEQNKYGNEIFLKIKTTIITNAFKEKVGLVCCIKGSITGAIPSIHKVVVPV